MNKRLPRLERYFYLSCWIFTIIFSAFRIHIITENLSSVFENQLTEGWSFLGRKQDNADEEWRRWVNFILFNLSPWILIHYVGARVIYFARVQFLPFWYQLVTVFCVIHNFGIGSCLVFLAQPVIFILILKLTRSRIVLWSACFVVSRVFTHERAISTYSSQFDDMEMIGITLMWIYLRCISFSMDLNKEDEITWLKSCEIIGYVFYLPCFFLGPILLFSDFHKQMYNRNTVCTFRTEYILILQNLRYLFWLFSTEILLHFIYINCVLSYVSLFAKIKYEDVWIMYGIGFYMGQFFFLKYTVVYGLALTWTRAEGYETPDPPKCVAHICFYSDMWRYFDRPLYLFLKRYIYEPCLSYGFLKSSNVSLINTSPQSILKKMMVSLLCFVFIYVWHGVEYYIFCWALFNYCGIVLEIAAREISKHRIYCRFKNTIGFRNERRFIGALCSPLTILSAISNFYFIGGSTVAETYFSYIFIRGTTSSSLLLWFFVYCLCQVSMDTRIKP